jgi:RNAse (barnase) inhibitor barstar
MRRIVLNVAGCASEAAFNNAVATVLEAPDWHGRNLDAWWDSIISDDINDVRAPYVLVIEGMDTLVPEIRQYVERFVALFDEARAEGGLDVRCILGSLN